MKNRLIPVARLTCTNNEFEGRICEDIIIGKVYPCYEIRLNKLDVSGLFWVMIIDESGFLSCYTSSYFKEEHSLFVSKPLAI